MQTLSNEADECKEQHLEKIERVIRTDNKDEFSFFLKNHLESSGLSTPIFSSFELLKLICLHRAVGCAAALLEGKTGLCVDLKVAGGLSPLNLAAESLSYGLTKLFLQHGAWTKSHSSCDSVDLVTSPLSVALKALCYDEYVSDWSPNKSVYKLLYVFCMPELKQPLGTIKLLASKTSSKLVERICSHCVKEGEIVQLTALLFGAWKKLLAPYSNEGLESCPVWQFIMRGERELEHGVRDCDSLKNKLSKSQEVLQILWRALDIIEEYRYSERPIVVPNYEVPFDVAYLLFRKARLVMKPGDVYSNDLKCLKPRLNLEDKAVLNEAIEKQIHAGADIFTSIMPSTSTRWYPDAGKSSFRGDIQEKLDDALSKDNKDRFLNLIKGLKHERNIDTTVFNIYRLDSVKCAAAVLAGEANGKLCLTSGFDDVGWTPLHKSSLFAAHKITAFLLEAGFSADARSNWKSLNLKEQLPLNVALRGFRSDAWVDTCYQRKSAVILIAELCHLNARLETVRLLAQHTKELKHEFFNYVKEGNMFEVGALLMVAGEKLMPLSMSDGVAFNNLREISHFLQAKKDTWLAMSNDELTEMKGTLYLLDMFDKIGDKLRAYVRLSQNDDFRTKILKVASLTEAAGFDVKIEDVYYRDELFRVRSSAFEWKILRKGRPEGLDIGFCQNHLPPAGICQRLHVLPFCSKSQRPSIPTRHLLHTSSFQKFAAILRRGIRCI